MSLIAPSLNCKAMCTVRVIHEVNYSVSELQSDSSNNETSIQY